MRIDSVTTYLVGNAWKNWLFVRVDTDEGIHGVRAPDDRAAKVAPGPTAAGLTADPIGSPDPGR